MSNLRQILPNLFVYEDTCNSYLVRDGTRGLVIDCGSGHIESLASTAGVASIDWVLFTHHHRDQCSGAGELASKGARLAVPQHERYLFENASDYWQQKRIYDNYNDRSTFFSLGESVPVQASLLDYEKFDWGTYEFFVLPTPGHTLGSVSLVGAVDGRRVAFTGDLLHAGGKLYQLHALEYEYGDIVGANWVAQSLQALKKEEPEIVLPSHGPLIDDPKPCIDLLDARLHELMDLQTDRVGHRFAHEIEMEEISPHLLWGSGETCSNFYVIKSDTGRALFIDYPHPSHTTFMTALHSPEPFATLRFIEHHLDELRERWGISSFDLVIPTHIHDDHVCGIPHLQRHHNTQCWALEDVAKVLESPERWNTPCLFPDPIRIDRRFQDGDSFTWEEFPLEIVFYPGQTEFHAAILGEIDGRRVLFSGDSSYPLKRYLPDRQREWMVNTVLRNSLTLSMHRKCADEFDRLRPDLLCPGHGPYWKIPDEAFAEHRGYIEKKESLWRKLLPEPADLGIDLFWARILPYQISLDSAGTEMPVTVELRNSFDRTATFNLYLRGGELEFSCRPRSAQITLEPEAKGEVTFSIAAATSNRLNRRHLLTAQVSVDARDYGPVTEALVTISER